MTDEAVNAVDFVDVNLDLDRIVSVYIKVRDKKAELMNEAKAKEEEIDKKLRTLEVILLEHCKKTGATSVSTKDGTFFRSIKKKFWTGDWEAMNRFIIQHEALGLLEKRIHQTNMKQFLEENPDLLPPGLNVDSEYTITVRRKK